MTDHSASSATNAVDDLIRLDDAAFARELGLPVGEPEAVAPEATEAPEVPESQPAETAASPEAEGDAPGQPRDELGRFAKPEEGEPVEGEPEAEAEGEPAPEAKPEADAPEPPKLATSFEAFDEEGAYDPADLHRIKVKYKANGKEHVKTFDEVVRTAQTGHLREDVLTERDQLRVEKPKLEAEVHQIRQELEEQRALALRLLQDDDYLMETRELLKQQLSPEGRAERAERQLQEFRRQQETAQFQQQVQGFTQGQVLPRLEQLQSQFPTVTQEEMIGLFTVATAPLMRNGAVPPEQWSRVIDLIEGEIGQRMAHLHESRNASAATVTRQAQQQVTRAQEEATKVKRTLARAVKAPTSGASRTTVAAKSPAPPKSAEEAIEQIVGQVASGTYS